MRNLFSILGAVGVGVRAYFGGTKMKLRWCKKCNKMCHCIQADSENECTNCDCKEPEGVVIDDTMDDLKKRIKKHEGFVNTVYKDSLGKRTVGYGHLCVEDFWEDNKKYDKEYLDTIFEKDFVNACDVAMKLIRDLVIAHDAKLVIVEMCFQLGYRVSKFKKMWEALKVGNYSNASKEMLNSNWHKQTPKRCEFLAKIMKES